MGRSTKKGPFVDVKLLRKVQKQQEAGTHDPIKTWARSSTVVPEFVGQTFMVHNGRTHLKVFVTEDMVGHKLGEFAATRVFRGHSGRKAAMAAAGAAPGAPGAPAGGAPAGGGAGKKE
jgi:small subunit ribosomal protein S19